MVQNGGRTGSRFGPYELRALLGRGGMGEVYEAHDTVKDRVVALKVLPEALAGDDDFRERFRREARTAARLQEPHVIPIHDFGEIDGVLFIDMRLVRGEDLKTVVRRGPLGTARSLAIVSQVASALDAAHRDGLVHRDIKPENIMITADDFAYLADFGIAAAEQDTRLTGTGSAVGSLAYMAPERFQDAPISGAVDIYALGCVLYECLTGRAPYPRTAVSSQIAAHLYEPPPSLSGSAEGAPVQLDEVMARALAKDPAHRYRTAGEFAAAARAAVSAQDQDAATTIIRRAGVGAVPVDSRPTEATPLPPTAGWGAPADGAASSTGGASGRDDGSRGRGAGRAWWIAAACAVLSAILIGGLLVNRAIDDGGRSASAADATPTGGATPTDEQRPTGDTQTSGSGGQETQATSSAPDEESSSTSEAETSESSSSSSASSSSETSTSSEPEMSGAGYGRQGWATSPDARCNVDDPAVTVGRTAKTYLVVCRSDASGGHYYRAYRTTGGGATEIQHPRRVGSGWLVQKDGYSYRIGSSSLEITDPSGTVVSDERMEQYDSR